jgi:formylglycine-generating enzyme
MSMIVIERFAVAATLSSVLLLVACGSSGSNIADAAPADVAASKPCPAGRGPSMVRVPSPGSTFCIDSTEVTRTQYRAFTSTVASGSVGEASLEKADICQLFQVEPKAECMQEKTVCKSNCDNHPQVCINWCAAYAYCKWAGKRLCGGLDGKSIKTFVGEPQNSAWLVACGNGVATDGTLRMPYAYGESLVDDVCNSPRVQACRGGGCSTVAVGTLPKCQGRGSYKGVFDLAGNVSEYVDERDSSRPQTVRSWGSSFDDRLEQGEANGCTNLSTQGEAVDGATPFTGFRCCAD